ncbi:MAG TPA: hypothetical protein DDY32_01345 [Desulfobulbaceae bacterium]|nr:hypothetical protein [Desulfobulbaceae bacterium]
MAISWPDSELSQEDLAGQIFKEEPVQAGLFERLGTLWEEPVGVHEIVLIDGSSQYPVESSCLRFYLTGNVSGVFL